MDNSFYENQIEELELTVEELGQDIAQYQAFYESILDQVGDLMMEDPLPDSDEGKLLEGLCNIIAEAEIEAGWELDSYEC